MVFLEPGGDDAGNPASGQRLLLHGAEQHLLHRASLQQTSVHDFSKQTAIAEGWAPEDGVNYASLFDQFLTKLAYADALDVDMEFLESWLEGERGILERAIPGPYPIL
ncbi:hypothetical protein DFQ14_109168 [Halopolyspora algeriensis]|uniref:Uncharacterized protein n=1 Tax=Halopolyspora algeriensis TaxID=1500506 RepID=A0A368VIQ2_9ACTN|nr:hypothetical protein [Halopolyspora algeriensis]RCW41091.1 hypothetical protein DFQ14_109168 [Halopolyspora algeriensis]TQM53826.1 hypothetical protein FHU43_1995 [Halopolyspora algeriensis]